MSKEFYLLSWNNLKHLQPELRAYKELVNTLSDQNRLQKNMYVAAVNILYPRQCTCLYNDERHFNSLTSIYQRTKD